MKKDKPQTEVRQQPALGERNRRYRWLLTLGIFCWPFVYLHSLVFVVNGHYRALGNDFVDLYYKYKVYLLDNLANLNFPLWSPSEAAGYPFYSNPFAQAFYPFNVLLATFYKILGGYTAYDHQIFTILAVSISALGLFAWLRLINGNLRAVVFATLVMAVSFKSTEILRFPNAAHTAAWYPWILYGFTRIFLSRSGKDTLISASLLCVFLICMLTGGYPYYIYYSMFLFVPYIAVFLIRPLRVRLIGTGQIRWKRAIAGLVIAGLIAGVICAPYLLATKHLMDQTTDRGGKNYEYSVSYPFNFQDTVGSLVYPPAAQAEGWYFFSITGVLLIVLYLFRGRTAADEKTKSGSESLSLSEDHNSLWVKIFFLVWFGLISYISYGRDSYLFGLLWKHLPGFASLRAWGRLNIIFVPILAWLLSLAYNSFEASISGADAVAGKRQWKKWIPLAVIVIAYGIVLAIQLHFYRNGIIHRFWWLYFKHVSLNDVLFLRYGAIAFTALFVLLTVSRWSQLKSDKGRGLALAGLVIIAAVEMEHVGTRQWTIENQQPQKRVLLDVARMDMESFSRRRIDQYGTISLGPNFSVATVRNWYFNRYVSFLKQTQNELGAQKRLLGVDNGQKIYFSEGVKYSTVTEFLQDALRYQQAGRLVFYSGDELRWEIDAPADGYLSFIDNWDDGWKVFVDDKPAQLDLLFGTFKSVPLRAGLHNVRFVYRPRVFEWNGR